MHSIFWRTITAISCAIQLAASDSGQVLPDSEWKRLLADGGRLYEHGHFNEAERAMQQAVEYAEQFPPLDPRLPSTIHALGFLYQEQGKLAEAKACYVRAIHLWQKIGPAEHQALSKTLDNMIGIYMSAHEYEAAEKLARSRLREMEGASNWRDRAIFLNPRAALEFRLRRYQDAESSGRQSLDLWQEHFKGEERNYAIVLMNLSMVYEAAKRYQSALDAGTRAVAALEGSDPTLRPVLAWALDNAAHLLSKLDRLGESERLYSRALETAKDVFGPDHPTTGRIMLEYSSALRRLNRKAEAKATEAQARTILRSTKPIAAAVDTFELGLLGR